MRRVSVPMSLAILVVLAGCSFAPPDMGMGPQEDSWDGDPDNPWREATLTVAVVNEANQSRDYMPQVREALSFWSDNANQYAGYSIDYRIRPNASDPDVTIRFVDAIEDCGEEGHTAGCAPIIHNASQVSRPAEVRVQGNFSDESTVHVLKHELGHTLGLEHGDPPEWVMRHASQLTTLPQRDGADKAMAWQSPNLSVYVDYANVSQSERDETERQVAVALDYYAAGAEGHVPDNVSFTRTSNRSAADITVVFADSVPCTDGAGSCGNIQGRDPDGDGKLETYTSMRITLAGVDTEARAWHVGYWLGRAFGLQGEELPAPLQSDDPQVRRSEWWR